MMHECHVFFETLGYKLKLNIISKLKEKPMIVTELSEELNQERSKVSHALISLLDCKFIHVKKDGRKRIYSLNSETILPLLNIANIHIKKFCKKCKN